MKARLDELLVARGHAPSRAAAQSLISEGKVRVKDCAAPKSGNKYDTEISIEVAAPSRFVSRGGEKLEGAFANFGFTVEGLDCLDVGASTGGFTDCLLQHGAARVCAIDVGRAQLHPRLQSDPRVTSIEGFNCRAMTRADLPFIPTFAVCDVSFISLRLILPPMAEVLAPGGGIITLIKPQFEAGREHISRGGVVRDPAVRQAVVESIRAFGEIALSLDWQGVCESPIVGAKSGNVEFTSFWRKK
jgi:hemolysin TlyA family protein